MKFERALNQVSGSRLTSFDDTIRQQTKVAKRVGRRQMVTLAPPELPGANEISLEQFDLARGPFRSVRFSHSELGAIY